MSIRDLFERLPKAKPQVTPAQAHVKACLATAREFIRTDEAPAGWKTLGAGYFSYVYGVDDSTVVKIGRSLDGGYVYAMWCLGNQHLEGVPRIYAVQKVRMHYKYMDQPDHGYIVVMERLEELSRSTWGDLDNADEKAQFSAVGAAKYRDDYEQDGDYIKCAAADAIVKLRRELSTQIQVGRKQRGKGAYGDVPSLYFDLHEGNVMMRGDVMVVTDPIATIKEKSRGKFSRKRYAALRAYC